MMGNMCISAGNSATSTDPYIINGVRDIAVVVHRTCH